MKETIRIIGEFTPEIKAMSQFLLLFFLFVVASSAHAMSDKEVVFFGGVAATSAQIRSCYPDFLKAYAWGQGASGVNEAANLMNSPANKKKHYLIAGHSSGAKFANQLAMKVVNPERLTLVDLDGYAPDQAHRKVKDTTCWRASSGNALSRNYRSMQASRCGKVETYTKAKQCNNGACLHFALVNANAKVTYGNWLVKGYSGCRPNRDWIKATAKSLE
jgi:hypothetical protein